MASFYHVWRRSHIHYQRRGIGDPLLLIHNIYPGASHEEFDHNLADLARSHTVYAIDLLGFGDSDAPRRRYTAKLYVELIADFIRQVIGRPTSVMACGLTCAYVSRVAVAEPRLIDRLIFVCPRSEPTGLDLPRWAAPIRHFMLTTPVLGQSHYDALSSEAAIKQYLQGCFHRNRNVTRARIDRLRYNATRKGSSHAYAGLIVGYLDCALLESLPKVQQPMLLIWGRHARPMPVEHSVRILALARRCTLQVVEEAGAWVHDEQSAKVNRLVLDYLATDMVDAPHAQTAQQGQHMEHAAIGR